MRKQCGIINNKYKFTGETVTNNNIKCIRKCKMYVTCVRTYGEKPAVWQNGLNFSPGFDFRLHFSPRYPGFQYLVVLTPCF